MTRMSEKEYEALLAHGVHREVDHTVFAVPADGDNYTYEKPKQNKMRNVKTEVDGIKFDSIVESERYAYLKLLEQAGEIHDLELQPSFTLLNKYEWRGIKYRAITYKADFKYQTKGGQTVVEDVKGKPTQEFKLKWKWLMYVAKEYDSPIRFLIVAKAKGKWMEFDSLYDYTKTFPNVGKKGKKDND